MVEELKEILLFNKEEDTLSIGCKTVDRLFVKQSFSVVNSILASVF